MTSLTGSGGVCVCGRQVPRPVCRQHFRHCMTVHQSTDISTATGNVNYIQQNHIRMRSARWRSFQPKRAKVKEKANVKKVATVLLTWVKTHEEQRFYRAMLRTARLCDRMSSVRDLEVYTTYFHTGWNTSKIISRPNSLRHLLTSTPTWAIWCNGNTPKLGWSRGGARSTKNLQYLRNGAR